MSFVCVHTSLFIMKELASCVFQTQIKSFFQHICQCKCQPPHWEGEICGLIQQSQWREKMQSHCEQIDEDDLFLLPPLSPQSSLITKDIRDNVGGRECQKGKEKRTKVCWCVKADKVGSSVATFSYLMADLSKCIGSLLGSVAVRLERNCTKILPSIRSVLIRLAQPSSSSCIWISGRAGAGVAHVPELLRVPSAACQYAQDTVDQCLLNHFPNRGNDNYKKWRLCTLCKCCAMTLEPNGPSY